MASAMVINSDDNVAIALENLPMNKEVLLEIGDRVLTITTKESIPFGHKLAIKDIAKGAPVIKYGETIGLATTAIGLGEHVHIHNIVSQRV